MNQRLLAALIFLAALVLLAPAPATAALTCEIQASTTCSAGFTKYLGLENATGGSTNAHAQTHNYTGTTYANSLCCQASYGDLAHSCSEGDNIVQLSSQDNAHVQANNETSYPVDACISHDIETIACRTTTSSCSADEACMLSLSSSDNAHAGACGDYAVTICCELPTDPANNFITTWKTDNPGPSNDDQITLPLEESGNYSFSVDWGDGTSDTITAWDDPEVTHTYTSPGTYNVTITGTIEGWRFNFGGDRQKILDVSQWGDMKLGNNGNYFHGASNLIITANDTPDLLEITNMNNAFRATDLSTANNISNWDVSSVTDMSFMFQDVSLFNQPLNTWDVSSVTDMRSMFRGASSFDQSLGGWDVSSVTNMWSMFRGASSFDQPLDSWNVSSVTTMRGMFFDASSFNQPLNSWDVSNVTRMDEMFWDASSFNQPLNSWDVFNVTTMGFMFFDASSFDQNLSSWNISSLEPTDWNGLDQAFDGSSLSTPNYDAMLNSWPDLSPPNNMPLGANNTQYSLSGVAGREALTDTYNWTITDAGLYIEPPTLVSPSNNNHSVFERYLTFNWSPPETISGVWHELNITAPGACDPISVINTSSATTHEVGTELCVDEVYEWSVRTCYEDTCSAWAAPYNFTVASVVSISLTQSTTDFGELDASTATTNVTRNTVDDAANPLVLNNTGNVRIDTSVRAEGALWSNEPLGTQYFQYADQGTTSWSNLQATDQLHTTNLLYELTRALEIRVHVPVAEPPGAKSSTLTLTAESAE